MYSNKSKIFTSAIALSILIAVVLYILSFYAGRETVFLWLNNDFGKAADQFFNGCSYLAEGWIWIPYFILVFGWFKKDALLILLNFLISTLLTQIPKNFIWDKVSRPLASGIPHEQIHTVKGVEMHLWNSFPSGHTATAFTLFLLTTYLFPKKPILIIGAFYAIACGYSRVYLGQHFPLDVAGGITVSIITILLSIYLKQHEKKNLSNS
jgi:membrane-associated phospholipid phosphatase